MDITNEKTLEFIRKSPNKSHWRVRSHVRRINTEIGMLRFTAMKNKGTIVATVCNRRANDLEKLLNQALDNQ